MHAHENKQLGKRRDTMYRVLPERAGQKKSLLNAKPNKDRRNYAPFDSDKPLRNARIWGHWGWPIVWLQKAAGESGKHVGEKEISEAHAPTLSLWCSGNEAGA